MSRAVSFGELQHISASQISNFSLCPRRWWFEKVAGVVVPPTGPTGLGGDIHRQMEAWYLERVPPEYPSALLLATSGLVPEPGPGVLIEHPNDFAMAIDLAGVPVRGRIDLINLTPLPEHGRVEIWDWKSKADFRYAKTADQLARDVQMNIYGKYVYEWYEPDEVVFVHGNIRTGKGAGYKIVKSDPVFDYEIDGYVAAVVEPIVRDMKTCAQAGEFEAVKENLGSCYAFNKPCPHLETCQAGKSATNSMAMLFKHEGEGVKVQSPNDANTTTVPLQGAITTTVTDEELAKALRDYELKFTTNITAQQGLTLYINAMPVKGVRDYVYLDDIIAEASREICAKLSTPTKPVVDLRMVAYGEGKGHLAAGLRKNPPTGVVVATTGELSDVAIEALLPLANVVIRGTR